MSVFIGVSTVLTLLVVLWLARPLVRTSASAGVSAQRLNAAIYRDQLLALDDDLAAQRISADEYESSKDELQLRLLDDTQTDDKVAAPAQAPTYFWSARITVAILAVLIPMGSAGMYGWLGTPSAIDPVATQNANAEKINEMVAELAAKVKANPDNLKGWVMLARSYKVLGRNEEAREAFEKAGSFIDTDANLLVEYADLLGVLANGNLEGKPMQLINKALALDPKQPMGLMLSGIAAYSKSDYKSAVTTWEKLLQELEPGSPDAQQVEANIAEARNKAGMPAAKAPKSPGNESGKLPPVDPQSAGPMTPEKINQMVERLAERLKSNPDDLEGWARLARAYKVQGKLPQSEDAYKKAGKLVDTNPDLLTQYADVLAMRAGNSLEGRPLELVNKALKLEPKHPMALMMAGTAAYKRASYSEAISYWERVLAVLPKGSAEAQQVQSEIASARAKGGLSKP